MIHRIKRHIKKHINTVINDFNKIYFLLALCYITMVVISIIKLNETHDDKDKWYVILTLCVYIMVALLYAALSYFSFHT